MVVWDRELAGTGKTELTPEETKSVLMDANLMEGLYSEFRKRTGFIDTMRGKFH
jgi:hypothetical protein